MAEGAAAADATSTEALGTKLEQDFVAPLTAVRGALELLRDFPDMSELERERFDQLVEDPATRERLVASKTRGLEAGVTGTPTLFIDGRRYDGDLDIAEVIDVLEEAHDRTTGALCDPAEASP